MVDPSTLNVQIINDSNMWRWVHVIQKIMQNKYINEKPNLSEEAQDWTTNLDYNSAFLETQYEN